MARGGGRIETKPRRDYWGIIVGAIVLIFATAIIGQSTAQTNPSAPPDSINRADEQGLGGIYRLLAERHQAVQLQVPPNRIPADVERLVLWGPEEVTDQQWADLKRWVQDGHTLVLYTNGFGWEGRLPYGSLSSEVPHTAAHPSAATPATSSVQKVTTGGDYFAQTNGPSVIHLKTDAGEPVLISWAEGAGRIYWSADEKWLTNGHIATTDNLALALNLLTPSAGKRIAFDEYAHGYQAAQQWWQLMRGSLLLFVGFLAVAVALFFWGSGTRFGAPRPAPATPPRAAVEYVYSMSHLYRRAGARTLARQALQVSVLRELGRLLGGLRGQDRQEIAQRVAERIGRPAPEIHQTLERLADGQSAEPSESELIHLAGQVEQLQRSVRNGRYHDQRNAEPH